MFIVFEGVDGSGKSTQVEHVVNTLARNNIDLLWLFEPSVNLNKDASCYDYLAAMKKTYRYKILKHLNKGGLVISDRWADSTIVYQFMIQYLSYDDFKAEYHKNIKSTPDLTFIFDIDASISQKRILSRDHKLSLPEEDYDTLDRIAKSYISLPKCGGLSKKYHIIDATQPMRVITKHIVDIILENRK